MNKIVARSFSAIAFVLCGLVVTGCTPAVQTQSVGTQKSNQVIKANVTYEALKAAIVKSDSATMYRIKSSIQSQDGTRHTNYSLYGYVNLPNMLSVQVHENSFNISFYQQGQVAYTDDLGTWTQSNPVEKINGYQTYDKLVNQAISSHTPLQQMNKVYVDNEYCDVYQMSVRNPSLALPAFLQTISKDTAQSSSSAVGQSAKNVTDIQYTFYVGQTSGDVREVQSKTIEGVAGLGPITTSTDTTFFDINSPQQAQITVPPTLVKQLENKGS